MHFLGKKQKKTGKQHPFIDSVSGLHLNIIFSVFVLPLFSVQPHYCHVVFIIHRDDFII